MDQENSKGQDKRNWRERLGIGAQGGKDLPKISDDFRKDSSPASARPATPSKPVARPATATGVKPAPMAPRATPRATPAAPVPPEKLAERLRSQREASTKLAEQRVQVAKQRAEGVAASAPGPIVAPQAEAARVLPQTPAPKPKFSFAVEGSENKSQVSAAAAPQQPRPAISPMPNPVGASPQLAPARPPLGGGLAQPASAGFTPRPPQAGFPANAPQGYPPSGAPQQGYAPGYGQQAPLPGYRPIDPAVGYQPTGFPQQQMRGYGPGVAPGGPRLNVPPRAGANLNPAYPPSAEYGMQPQPGFRAPPQQNRAPLRAPAPLPGPEGDYEDEFYDEMPAPRAGARPTSSDYQQAYREAAYGYEDEPPRSKAPWILAALLLLSLITAAGVVWGYQNLWKPAVVSQAAKDEVPAVAAPDAPSKIQPEQQAAQPAAATPNKKQIYDRIVGDQEILGGDVSAPLEVPAAIPEPTGGNGSPAPAEGAGGSSGEDAAPLPIPPPPGGATGQQGALDGVNLKQSAETITPAAGESQAAVAAQQAPLQPEPATQVQAPTPVEGATQAVEAPPAPGELATAGPENPEAVEPTDDAQQVKPVSRTLAEKKKPTAKPKVVAEKSLGSKPVVLVAPAKKKKAAAIESDDVTVAAIPGDTADGGLYSGTEVAAVDNQPATAVAPKKKKTLADLFKSADKQDDAGPADVASVETPAAKPVVTQPKKTLFAAPAPAPAPQPAQQAVAGSGYLVQLASFRTRDEATREFSRLKSKHAGTLGQFSPIVTEATVGGSTRYRLSVGRMQSQAQANSVCSSLFAGGERDCLVKRQ